MCKNPVDVIAEKLLAIGPIMSKKIIRFDLQCDEIMPINQLMVLGTLHQYGTISISEVCKKVFISKPQMTSIVDKLVKNGFAYRTYNKEDRRTININITEKGNEYCNNILEAFKKSLRNKLTSLSSEDLTKLLDSIQITETILKQLE